MGRDRDLLVGTIGGVLRVALSNHSMAKQASADFVEGSAAETAFVAWAQGLGPGAVLALCLGTRFNLQVGVPLLVVAVVMVAFLALRMVQGVLFVGHAVGLAVVQLWLNRHLLCVGTRSPSPPDSPLLPPTSQLPPTSFPIPHRSRSPKLVTEGHLTRLVPATPSPAKKSPPSSPVMRLSPRLHAVAAQKEIIAGAPGAADAASSSSVSTDSAVEEGIESSLTPGEVRRRARRNLTAAVEGSTKEVKPTKKKSKKKAPARNALPSSRAASPSTALRPEDGLLSAPSSIAAFNSAAAPTATTAAIEPAAITAAAAQDAAGTPPPPQAPLQQFARKVYGIARFPIAAASPISAIRTAMGKRTTGSSDSSPGKRPKVQLEYEQN